MILSKKSWSIFVYRRFFEISSWKCYFV